jgi:hypothetical protein
VNDFAGPLGGKKCAEPFVSRMSPTTNRNEGDAPISAKLARLRAGA